MEQRPHLIIDGALVAAATVDADDIVLYVGAEHTGAMQAMHRAVIERSAAERARRNSDDTTPAMVAQQRCVNNKTVFY